MGGIGPIRTAAGLVEAGERIRAVAGSGGRIIFGAGMPGALLVYYLGLARWVEELAGEVPLTQVRGCDERDVPLDWAGPVAVMGDGASLLHTHDPAPMRHVLGRVGAVDLMVADHGFAGAAIAAGIPAVAIMDTNGPAFAVAAGRGAKRSLRDVAHARSRRAGGQPHPRGAPGAIFFGNAYRHWQTAPKEPQNPRPAPEPIQVPNAHRGHSH